MPVAGALVISLDFELHWGVRDHRAAHGPYRANLLGVRRAVPALLELFERFGVAATWATVGFLFASSRDELERYLPPSDRRPRYRDAVLEPYGEAVGLDEAADPLHLAGTMVDAIRSCPGQEIATHTFSHYYCMEPGQDASTFDSDLASAVAIATAKRIRLRTLVFPRNQHNPAYAGVLKRHGIDCYRGSQRGRLYRPGAQAGVSSVTRIGRLADAYVPVTGWRPSRWEDLIDQDGLCSVPANCFLRPAASGSLRALEGQRLRRVTGAMSRAADENGIFHLWWHPHNFGVDLEQNLTFLRRVLEHFDGLRASSGMVSLSMGDAADLAFAYR